MMYVARDKRRPAFPSEPGLYCLFADEPRYTNDAGWVGRLIEMLTPDEYRRAYPTAPTLQPGEGPEPFDLLMRKAG